MNPRKGPSTWMIVLGILGVVIIGIPLALLAVIAFLRDGVADSRTYEAHSSIHRMTKHAIRVDQSGRQRICPSASHPVPRDINLVRGRSYQSTPAEWTVDAATNSGFACLGFDMTGPQYYQYSYTADAKGYTITIHGDLDGDGKLSTYTVRGGDTPLPVETSTDPNE